jgi:DNA-binding IclR family transcriptional regulator
VINLPCVSADGKPTKSGIATLTAIKNDASTAKNISEQPGQPMFKVRSGLRELVKAGFVKQIENEYSLTEQGNKIFQS